MSSVAGMIRSFKYFALDKGDPERSTSWDDEVRPWLEKERPDILKAWNDLKIAEMMFANLVRGLEEPYED